MKTYLAIGHFKDSKNMTSVAMKCCNIKNFRQNLGGNEFIPYVIISEKKMETLKSLNPYSMKTFEEVKKMTTNYRVWSIVTDYIEQCLDIMEDRFNKA